MICVGEILWLGAAFGRVEMEAWKEKHGGGKVLNDQRDQVDYHTIAPISYQHVRFL